MATVTDFLETVLVVKGGGTVIDTFRRISKEMDETAAKTGQTVSVFAKLKATLDQVVTPGERTAFGIKLIGDALSSSLRAAGAYEQAIFRTTVVLRNLGRGAEVQGLVRFAEAQAEIAGSSRNASVELVGQLARFKLTQAQIKEALPVLNDFARATGIDLARAGDLVTSALRGEKDAIQAFGVDLTVTGNKAKDMAVILKQLQERYLGGAGAGRQTITGSFEALRESVERLLASMGNVLATVVVPAVDLLTAAVDKLAKNVGIVYAIAGGLAGLRIGGPVGGAIGFAGGAALGFLQQRQNPAEQIGNGKAKLATEGTLQKIADNTAGLSPLIQKVIGGTGEVARGAASFRDFRMAFSV